MTQCFIAHNKSFEPVWVIGAYFDFFKHFVKFIHPLSPQLVNVYQIKHRGFSICTLERIKKVDVVHICFNKDGFHSSYLPRLEAAQVSVFHPIDLTLVQNEVPFLLRSKHFSLSQTKQEPIVVSLE